MLRSLVVVPLEVQVERLVLGVARSLRRSVVR